MIAMAENVNYGKRNFLKYVGVIGAGIISPVVLNKIGINPLEATAAEAAEHIPNRPKLTKAEVEKKLDEMISTVFSPRIKGLDDNNKEFREKIREPFYRLVELKGYEIVDG